MWGSLLRQNEGRGNIIEIRIQTGRMTLQKEEKKRIRHLKQVKRGPSQQRQGFRPLGRGGFLELAVPKNPPKYVV